MLNELWRLLQALEKCNIEREVKHKRIQVPGKTAPCLRVCLGKDGIISAVTDVDTDAWPTWTIMEGKQNSFPVVRIQEPLYHMPRKHGIWKEVGYDNEGRRRRSPDNKVRINALKNLTDNNEPPVLSKKSLTLWKRLAENKSKEMIQCASKVQSLKVIGAFAESFSKAAERPKDLLLTIARAAVNEAIQGKLNSFDFIEQLIIGKGMPDANGKHPNITVQIAFDVGAMKGDSVSIYSKSIRKDMIMHLPQEATSCKAKRCVTQSKNEGKDALTGETAILEKRTFPIVNLPVPTFKRVQNKLGRKGFPIASMFSAAHCNTRYGMTDAMVFPLAKERALHLKEALEEITADRLKEKTWQYIASGKEQQLDLLIAYVEEKPIIDVKTAGYFGQGQNLTEAQFEVDSSAVCAAYRGIMREKPKSKLNLFLIREVSKGQAQVVLSESLYIKDMLVAAEQWQQAATCNMPEIAIYLPPDKNADGSSIPENKDAKPITPYPDQVVRLLSYQWIRDGSSSQPIIGPGLCNVLDLMLRKEGKWEQTALKMVNLLVRRVGPLLIGLFGAKHAFASRRKEPLKDYPRHARETALRAVATIAILLDALASRKEQYMKEAPFQVGQVLALADTLHKDYCIVVRDGQMPNTLIGTSLMRRALDSPAGALSELSERMMEYIRWAKGAQADHSWSQDDKRKIAINEARKKLRQYQPLADALGSIELPKECNDIMKAQLLLGFLASPPAEKQNDEIKEE